eukprot:scaffold68525_cov63-Phaeocystis_antarctica.AAC.2
MATAVVHLWLDVSSRAVLTVPHFHCCYPLDGTSLALLCRLTATFFHRIVLLRLTINKYNNKTSKVRSETTDATTHQMIKETEYASIKASKTKRCNVKE